MSETVHIPSAINNVTIEFAATVDREVDERLVEGLRHCIKTDIAPGYTLHTIYISSASDSHVAPSRHAQSKAVDISRINGKRMSEHYGAGGEVTEITQAIQSSFETFGHRRENFGPSIKHKLGESYSVGGHADHIHLSVD
ncbi:MAG: hypothetical protein IPK80_25500 [Nannocystis sp.]|jgi:hypothetical protein|nr:hypothetical protein [Nannocystis sp.]